MEQPEWRNQQYNLWIEAGCPENTNVTRLELRNINNIPQEISNLTNLQELFLVNFFNMGGKGPLGKGPLNDLPSSIGDLAHLRRLEIKFTQLNSLPDSIGRLTTLRELILSYNMLTSLPDSIGTLENLAELKVSNNEINMLPESIGNLRNLIKLDLDRNRLTELPVSIGNLTNLTHLFLSNNHLGKLPESIGNLTSLTNLYLMNNRLTKLPDSIGNLAALDRLYVRGNNLVYLPKTIKKLTNLRWLDIDNNLKYPVDISTLVNLSPLDINKINQINQNIRETQSVEQPDLGASIALMRPLNSSQYKLRESGQDYETHYIPGTEYSNLPGLPRELISQFSHGYRFPSDNYNSSTNQIKQETQHNNVVAQSVINIALKKKEEEKRKAEEREAEKRKAEESEAEARERVLMESESYGANGGKRRRKTVRRTKRKTRKTVRRRKSMKKRMRKSI